jgi:hypothetical protein
MRGGNEKTREQIVSRILEGFPELKEEVSVFIREDGKNSA